MQQEPNYEALPQDTPPHLRYLIESCLRKEARDRRRDMGDIRLALQESNSHRFRTVATNLTQPEQSPPRPNRLPWLLAALLPILAVVLTLWLNPAPTQTTQGYHFELAFEKDSTY